MRSRLTVSQPYPTAASFGDAATKERKIHRQMRTDMECRLVARRLTGYCWATPPFPTRSLQSRAAQPAHPADRVARAIQAILGRDNTRSRRLMRNPLGRTLALATIALFTYSDIGKYRRRKETTIGAS
jgi:hypothetical protein